MQDSGRSESTAELRYSGRDGNGSLIVWETSTTYEVRRQQYGNRWMLLGRDGKEVFGTATSGQRRSERVVRIEIGGDAWEMVSRRAYGRRRWDVFRLGSGEGNSREKTTKRRQDTVGEIVGQGWRSGKFTVYVKREVPVEIVAFTCWIARKGGRCGGESGCAGG